MSRKLAAKCASCSSRFRASTKRRRCRRRSPRCRAGAGFRPRRVASHRRRQHRRHGRGGARHGVDHVVSAGSQPGPGAGVHGRASRPVSRRAPTSSSTPTPTTSTTPAHIPKLVQPILDGRAQIVIGERPIMQIEEFSLVKKLLQRLGSWAVAMASRTACRTRRAAFAPSTAKRRCGCSVFNDYTYTLETIIQAGRKNIPVIIGAGARERPTGRRAWSRASLPMCAARC